MGVKMNQAFLKRLKDLREDNDFTQQQVADKLGTSQTMYARYERGANELPIRHLIILSKLFLDVLFSYSTERNFKNLFNKSSLISVPVCFNTESFTNSTLTR